MEGERLRSESVSRSCGPCGPDGIVGGERRSSGRIVASLDRKCLGQKAFRDPGRRYEAF